MDNRYIFALPLLGALSCGEAGEPASAPGKTTAGISGKISFSVTSDEAPHAGENSFRICLATLPDGKALPEASVALQTWMPSMSHEGPTVPSPSALGEGCHHASVVFSMPGFWELHVQARDSAREDSVTLSYDIP